LDVAGARAYLESHKPALVSKLEEIVRAARAEEDE
jgi:hypothetical protein